MPRGCPAGGATGMARRPAGSIDRVAELSSLWDIVHQLVVPQPRKFPTPKGAQNLNMAPSRRSRVLRFVGVVLLASILLPHQASARMAGFQAASVSDSPELKQLKAALADANADETKLSNAVKQASGLVNAAERDLAQTGLERLAARNRAAQAAAAVAATTNRLQYLQAYLSDRVRSIYVSGSPGDIQALIQSADPDALLDQVTMLDHLAQQGNDSLTDLIVAKKDYAKAVASQRRAEQDAARAELAIRFKLAKAQQLQGRLVERLELRVQHHHEGVGLEPARRQPQLDRVRPGPARLQPAPELPRQRRRHHRLRPAAQGVPRLRQRPLRQRRQRLGLLAEPPLVLRENAPQVGRLRIDGRRTRCVARLASEYCGGRLGTRIGLSADRGRSAATARRQRGCGWGGRLGSTPLRGVADEDVHRRAALRGGVGAGALRHHAAVEALVLDLHVLRVDVEAAVLELLPGDVLLAAEHVGDEHLALRQRGGALLRRGGGPLRGGGRLRGRGGRLLDGGRRGGRRRQRGRRGERGGQGGQGALR